MSRASGSTGNSSGSRSGTSGKRDSTAQRPKQSDWQYCLLNHPAVRAKIALTPQGRELALVPPQGACADAEPTARVDVLGRGLSPGD
jgi:hypothetical protein